MTMGEGASCVSLYFLTPMEINWALTPISETQC